MYGIRSSLEGDTMVDEFVGVVDRGICCIRTDPEKLQSILFSTRERSMRKK